MPLIDDTFEPMEIPAKHARVICNQSQTYRYRVLRGGRSGGKDWAFASAAIERGVRQSTRYLCTREVQNTIKASIHQLLSDTILRLGYSDYFKITDHEIRAKHNDTSFIFKGLRDLNADNVKSIEGIDVCMIGEAQDMTKKSFTVLDPSIRKPGSELWIQFNEQFDDDFIYLFSVVNPPDDLICEQVLYTDNPWTTPATYKQAERMRLEDPMLYRNVWLGECLGQGGRVFPLYDKKLHEIDFDMSSLPQCDLYMSIDPHRKYYPAITWYAVTPTGATVVYNEWPRPVDQQGMWYDEARTMMTFDMTMSQLAAVILANDRTFLGGTVIGRTIDPRFAAEHEDFVPALQALGVLNWRQAPFERIETQRESLKTLIGYNPAIPVYGCNTPDWYVERSCGNKSRAYVRHSYAEDKDKEAETHKDFIDNDRYFLSLFPMGRPAYIERDSMRKGPPLKSMAAQMMQSLPAQGYYKVIK